METFTTTLLLILEFLLFSHSWRRNGLSPFPHGLFAYIMVAHLVILADVYNIISYREANLYSSYLFPDQFLYLNLSLFLLFTLVYFSIFIKAPNIRMSRKIALNQGINIIRQYSTFLVNFITITAFVMTMVVLFSINLDLMWKNDHYLLMGNSSILNTSNIISRFSLTAFKFIGLLSFIALAISLYESNIIRSFPLLAISSFHLIYQLGAHSRASFLFVAVFFMTLFLISKRGKVTLGIAGATISFAVLVFCVEGRSTGLHGISTAFDFFSIISNVGFQDITQFLLNIMQGVYISGEIFNYVADFNLNYITLSLSPFPSFIDGFDSILDANQVRLHKYIPASAFLELMSFGTLPFAIYVIVFLIASRLSSHYLYKFNTFGSVAANVMVLYASILQFSYPVRNVFRIYVLAIFVCLLVGYRNRLYRKDTSINPNGHSLGARNSQLALPPAAERRRQALQAKQAAEAN